MVNVASVLLGDFQDSLVDVFGSSGGWLMGHAIVLSMVALIVLSIRNRDHIVNESGYGREHFSQATAVVLMTGLQYVFYTGSLGFPGTMSMVLGITGALSALWMINVLE
ncbi:MAG: hypothetical protein CMA21_00360 [Euryarchaeota archaeon]|nr:hypothetical protein [Euryarchaeota archaeon]|tara:strand:+ start:3346 stop:3672 length:327 start_codon:yes stop_codon:yes gene_type:complete